MLLVALIAIGAVVLLTREGEAKSLPPDEWRKAMEEHAGEQPSSPTDESAQNKAFIDYYLKHKSASDNAKGVEPESAPAPRVGRLVYRGDTSLPPEYPRNEDDIGVGGDMDVLPDNLFNIVHAALLELHDPVGLFEVADSIEGAGYPLSANRLKRKALRLLAEGEAIDEDPLHAS